MESKPYTYNKIMCLYISKKKGIILEKDLICYKQLEKQEDGTWKTPIMYWIIPKLDTMITPDEDTPEISGYNQYKLRGGAIHAYLQLPRDRDTSELFYKAIIPKGTKLWISNDLSEVAARRMYITSEEVFPEDTTTLNISPLYHLGANLRLASGERVPLSSDINLSDVVGIYSGDKVLLKDVKDGIKFSEEPISEFSIRHLVKVFKDMNGEENCKLLPPDLPILREVKNQGGYIPALGELHEVFKNLLEVNISRVTLGLPIIPKNNLFWTSTLCNSENIWCCSSNGRLPYYYRRPYSEKAMLCPLLDLKS